LEDERRVEKSTEGGIVKLNDWIDETVEVQFVTRGEDDKPQTITGSLESVGDRASCSPTTTLPAGGCSSTPGTRSSEWRNSTEAYSPTFVEGFSLLKNPSTPLPSTLQGLKTPALAVFWR
jgi:hypothetical protein